jgi:N-alpha-acetyltransferase 50
LNRKEDTEQLRDHLRHHFAIFARLKDGCAKRGGSDFLAAQRCFRFLSLVSIFFFLFYFPPMEATLPLVESTSIPHVVLGPVHIHNVEQVKRINLVVFPVRYSTKFYSDIIGKWNRFTKLAYFKDVVVGAVSCRVEEVKGEQWMYIMTLGVLAAYRGMGIGSLLLSEAEQMARTEGVDGLHLHVQTSNTDAIEFYRKHEYEIGEILENYYTRIDPPHCHIVRKRISSVVAPQKDE